MKKVTVELTDEEYEILYYVAYVAKMSVSELIHQVVTLSIEKAKENKDETENNQK